MPLIAVTLSMKILSVIYQLDIQLGRYTALLLGQNSICDENVQLMTSLLPGATFRFYLTSEVMQQVFSAMRQP